MMQRVLDLSADVFAMPPYIHTHDDIDTDGNPQWIYKPTVPPAVGELIANTRSIEPAYVDEYGDAPIWADSPYLEVVERWPIQDESPYMTGTVWAKNDGTFWLIVAQHDPMEPPEGLPIHDLHGGQPGGWAIRVEPHNAWPDVDMPTYPPPTGRPLNHCEERSHQ